MNDQPPVNVNVTPPAHEVGYTVTLRDVSDKLNTKLDTLTTKIDTLTTLPAAVRDHEKRLREIEANFVSRASVRWGFTAVVGLIGAVATALALVLH